MKDILERFRVARKQSIQCLSLAELFCKLSTIQRDTALNFRSGNKEILEFCSNESAVIRFKDRRFFFLYKEEFLVRSFFIVHRNSIWYYGAERIL